MAVPPAELSQLRFPNLRDVVCLSTLRGQNWLFTCLLRQPTLIRALHLKDIDIQWEHMPDLENLEHLYLPPRSIPTRTGHLRKLLARSVHTLRTLVVNIPDFRHGLDVSFLRLSFTRLESLHMETDTWSSLRDLFETIEWSPHTRIEITFRDMGLPRASEPPHDDPCPFVLRTIREHTAMARARSAVWTRTQDRQSLCLRIECFSMSRLRRPVPQLQRHRLDHSTRRDVRHRTWR
jgi:hypothetical protein